MANSSVRYKRIVEYWELDKLRSALPLLENLYYNYDKIVSLALILEIKQEIQERVGDYEQTQELYKSDARGNKPSL